jgi:microcystin-dependent protein
MSTTASRIYNFVDDKNNGVPITATRIDGELNQVVAALNQKVIIKASAPSTPVAGQLWLDSTNKILKQYRSSEWVMMGVIHVATSAMATPQAGDFWLDSANNILKCYINSTWVQISGTPPTGSMVAWGTDSAPTGWLLCDGTAVSRTTYAALFSIISTTYGVGDNSTTFNLPNIKGKVIVGKDSAQTEFDALAKTGGAKTHTLSETEIPAHTHTVNVYETEGGGSTPVNGTGFVGTMNTGSTGGGQAHNNLQPYIVLNYIIKI